MGQSRWYLLVAVVVVSVASSVGSIPSTCIDGVCYSCPYFCSTIKTDSVGTPDVSCTCQGNGPDTLCPNTPCTVVESGSANVGVDTIVENAGVRWTIMGTTVLSWIPVVVYMCGLLLS